MKQTELSKISGVPISTLAEWKRTKPKLRALLELGAVTWVNGEIVHQDLREIMHDVIVQEKEIEKSKPNIRNFNEQKETK